MRESVLLPLAVTFISFSLTSIGGGPSVFAPMQHDAVDIHHWITAREFVELFAISRAAPGPGSMLSTVIGWQVDGWTGAIVATLALFLPSSLLCYGVARVWNRYRGQAWHTAVQDGLAPVGAGLILAGVLAIARVAGAGILWWGIAIAAAVMLGLRPKLHPMLLLLAGAVIAVTAWKFSS
jgi:chromate transporter